MGFFVSENEPKCEKCGNTRNLRKINKDEERYVCKWEGGCEHRQMLRSRRIYEQASVLEKWPEDDVCTPLPDARRVEQLADEALDYLRQF